MKRVVLTLLHNRIQVGIGSSGAWAGIDMFHQSYLTRTDAIEGWEDAARHLWVTENLPKKHILMVLPDSAFNIRILRLPSMPNWRLTRAVRDELQYNEKQELVTDYIPLGREESGVWRILACSCLRKDLQQFIDMSKRLGFELDGVTVPVAAAVKLLRVTHGMRDQSCIWLCFDGAALLSLLVERGVCRYTTRTTLMNGPGGVNFAAGVTQNVSNILQFRTEQHMNTPLSHIYYAGCSADDFEVCASGFQSLGLQSVCLPRCEHIVRFPQWQRMSDCLVCSGAMLWRTWERTPSKHKELDLYLRCRRYTREKPQRGLFKSRWFPVVVTALLCVLIWQTLSLRNRKLERELSAYQTYLNDPKNTASYEQKLKQEEIYEQLIDQTNSVRMLTSRLAVYPKIDSNLLARIEAAGGENIRTTVTGYDSSTGELLVQAESWTVFGVSGYVRDLERLDLFQSVSYTGYTSEKGLFTVQLKCILRAVEVQKEGLDAAGDIG